MELVTHPRIFDFVFFFQLVDNALADIAEGSYVVGEYAHLYGHGMSLSVVFSTRQARPYKRFQHSVGSLQRRRRG
jgi:hypothetical protein